MFRAAPRLIARPSALSALPRSTQTPTRRFISTAPPHKTSRSWKSLVGRVGVVGAIIYFYNTTELFAEEPRLAVHQVQPATDDDLQTELPTIEALAKERAQRKAELVAEKERARAGAEGNVAEGEGGVQELEEEAGQQGAFNPETGEINWDCPCLGGMATGPCGEQFKAAFSCFVHSTEEPKGMDCVDKFKDMQNCFREYPEVYGNELEGEDDDEVGDDELAALAESESAPSEKAATSRSDSEQRLQDDRAQAEVQQRKKEQALGGSDEVIPREAHDDLAANAGKKAIKENRQQ